MEFSVGIILALVAMLGWGFGDFLIQKSTRKFGDWETLFVITLLGAIVLLPFVYRDIPLLFSEGKKLFILALASIILLAAALLDFEALKKGKLAVVEPLWSLEIPVSVILAWFIIKEHLSISQIVLIISLIISLFLVSLRSYHLSKHVWLEKGTFLALAAALVMGLANFFVGFGSRVSDPLMMNWFLNIFIAGISFSYLAFKKKIRHLIRDINASKGFVTGMCLLDNSAWIAFAFAMSLAPIGIAVALSESYIILAVLLGVWINKEYLHKHQKLGLVIAIISAIALAGITG